MKESKWKKFLVSFWDNPVLPWAVMFTVIMIVMSMITEREDTTLSWSITGACSILMWGIILYISWENKDK